MKNQSSSHLFLIVLLNVVFLITAVSAQQKKTNKKKLSSVELQWEDSPGAFMYEVQIFNSKNKLIKTFVSKSSLFKFNSTSGKIKLRGRIMDAYGKKGLWSTMIEAEVPPEDIKFPGSLEAHAPIVVQASGKTTKGRALVDWPEAIQAKTYMVKIFDQDNKLVAKKETSKLTETFDLDIGIYRYSVTPIGIDQIPGKEVLAPRSIQIGSAQLPSEKFTITTDDNGGLQIKMPPRKSFEIYGALEYANHLSEIWIPILDYVPFTDEIWTPQANLQDKLKPGRYRIGFWTTKKGWVDSVKFRHEFVIKPTEADIAAFL